MREDEFRAWMQAKGQAANTVSTRLSDARRVEAHYGNLDAAYEKDKLAEIFADLAYTSADSSVSKPNTSRISVNGNPYTSLASYRSAISTYRQFLEGDASAVPGAQADRIRQFVVREYVEPARNVGQAQILVRAGDVHKAMGLQDALPAICSSLGSTKFEDLAGVRCVGRTGPEASTTTEFTFELTSSSPLDVAGAEAVLRQRYGSPEVDSQKMVSFVLSDGRAIALQRDVTRVQIWIEDNDRPEPPPSQKIEPFASERGRHSNLPPRLRHEPGEELRSLGFPRPVFNVRVTTGDELNRLLDWYEAADRNIDFVALEQLKVAFLAQFSDFAELTFDARSGGYFEQERRYKDALLAKVDAALAQSDALSDEELGSSFLDLLTGQESGLLGWRTDARIKNLRSANPGVVEQAAGLLVRSSGDCTEAVEAFVETTWPALRHGQEKSQPYSESRNIPSMLLALARPRDAIGINTEPLSRVYRKLTGKNLFAWKQLSADEYAGVLRFAQALFAKFEEWGWKPRDLWDVQSFIWVVKDQPSSPPENQIQHAEVQADMTKPTNLILYGPPGTGKTYQTAKDAVLLCDGNASGDRNEVKARYDALVEAGQIGFVTFHQSYAYEDFVEGLRPVTGRDGDDGEEVATGFRLEPRRGVFREIAALAEQARRHAGRATGFDLSGRNFFKMSLGRAGSEDHIYDAAIEGGYIVLGWGGEVDWSDSVYDDYQAIFDKWNKLHPGTNGNDGNISQLWRFRSSMRKGDIVIVSDGNSNFRAIGEVVGPYEYKPTELREYNHRRAVRWLLVLDESLPVETIHDGKFTMRSCYLLKQSRMKVEALSRLVPGNGTVTDARPDQFVLIIDEINRANISKVFGELITLIEEDKRLGEANAATVKLPYSGDTFGVPNNLHIVGTMNTADRSIALLDTALRRRFTFKELMPDPDVLAEASVRTGVNLVALLLMLNERIEYLFDREHQIGHAYFVHCQTINDVHETMRHRIIPLLAEYFYEDWSKVALVLGDAEGADRFVIRRQLTVPAGMQSDGFSEERYRWKVRDQFDDDAYSAAFG